MSSSTQTTVHLVRQPLYVNIGSFRNHSKTDEYLEFDTLVTAKYLSLDIHSIGLFFFSILMNVHLTVTWILLSYIDIYPTEISNSKCSKTTMYFLKFLNKWDYHMAIFPSLAPGLVISLPFYFRTQSHERSSVIIHVVKLK